MENKYIGTMMFCPNCGKLLKSKDGALSCSACGYSEKISAEEKEQMKKVAYMQENEILVVDGEEIGTKPTIAVQCPNCGHKLAEWWLRQLRSADESEVRFFRCTKCHHTWREYD